MCVESMYSSVERTVVGGRVAGKVAGRRYNKQNIEGRDKKSRRGSRCHGRPVRTVVGEDNVVVVAAAGVGVEG